MWRARLLHVLLIAPAAALTAAALGSGMHAQASTSPPAPIVVVIDPGHGGSANPANPSQLFDPGAIGANGVEEKDVALDVGKQLAQLLNADEVHAILTRSDDVYLTIPQREQVAIDNGAVLFVSIHVNSFTQPGVGGSLVLYPNEAARPFAQALSDAMTRGLAGDGVGGDGVQLRDNWWTHAPMPTATVEVAYLTNPREAALMSTESFRADVAAAIRAGIERYDPQIARRASAIRAWRAQHPGAPAATPRPAAHGAAAAPIAHAQSWLGAVMPWLVTALAVLAVLRWPRAAARLMVGTIRLLAGAVRTVVVHRRAVRRRQRVRTRQATRSTRPHSVYDELWL